MATDGQGVILAVPHSVDARQRAAIDLLSRRVSHRLGCPAAAGQVQRGTLHLDAPLADLHAKGAREIVVVPLTLTRHEFNYSEPPSRSASGSRRRSMSFRVTEPLGGAPEIITTVIESLNHSERLPDPSTRIVLVLPFAERAAAPELEKHLDLIAAAGWQDGRVHSLPTNGTDCELAGVLEPDPGRSSLLVPLVVAPGPFADRVAKCAAEHGVDMANVSFHASEALTALIYRRVLHARRA
ncbi:MAG: hypothetical protein H6525_11875 [Actinobacteria bacterium]|nr:hypothetical protein [Actinomycetota bacterium]MCB9413520.1 hypothetical protein [Actinomycetota bacterium]